MSAILTVSSAERTEPRLRLGVATLPTLFEYVDGGAEVAGVTGNRWIADAVTLIEGEARGVLVVDPEPDDIAPLRDAVSTGTAAVVFDIGWASSPSVALAAPRFRALIDPEALVESRIDAARGDDPAPTLLRQLALLREAVEPVTSLRIVRLDGTGYDVLGKLEGGADVSMSAVFSDALEEGAEVRVVRQKSTVALRLGPVAVASPGRIRVLDDFGENHLLAPYETPHREAWRRLHRAVSDGSRGDDLAAVADDIHLVLAAVELYR